ncbi:hypothetical protein VZT92_010261 [Zoarces viviparus]|uniref:Reverse transcriptase n=1 Tax=Zoarces viviparus TaxID=48416 RepID=A0AAW1FH08_ZOAVI
MLQKVKEELQRMDGNGIIERVTQPTDWCAPMVPVLKKSTGKARICVDLKRLNEAVKREQYILPTIDEITEIHSMPPVGSSRYRCTQTAVSSLPSLRHLADSTSSGYRSE